MTIADWLVASMIKLQVAEVPNGRTDCLVLLTDMLDKDKSWVHTHPEFELSELQTRELDFKLDKRVNRIPLAYIRGFNEFYGRKFMVNSRVLIPRPESESFIEILKTLHVEMPRIADIGTGSGCLGITAALELPDATVHLYDIDPGALAIAHHNARQHGCKLEFYESNLLQNLQFGSYDILLANLPYVPNNVITSPEIETEPAIALFSGKDGLNHYKAFWHQVETTPALPKYILTESLENQHDALIKLARDSNYKHVKTDVLVQLFERDF